jgi:hypothetical protein
MADAAAIVSMANDEFVASYRGREREEYVRVLTGFVSDCGGSVEPMPLGLIATFGPRRIAIRFE